MWTSLRLHCACFGIAHFDRLSVECTGGLGLHLPYSNQPRGTIRIRRANLTTVSVTL